MLLNAYLNKHLKKDIQEYYIYLENLLHHFLLIQQIDQIYIKINLLNKLIKYLT